ncbi:MAG TPA: acyl-CoA synthetase [Microthrixaceae bacterium]|nr:acyl-CoA synthetase [Microthrixaceae bacterium]
MEFNLAQIHETVERVVPNRECIVFRDRRFTYAAVGDRTRRLANALIARGLGSVQPRSGLAGHQSGQDHLAIYLHNSNEYLESMLGAYKARLVPFNVNYRYVADELEYLLRDADSRAIIFHSTFAPTLAEVRDRLPRLTTLFQVPDDSGNDLLEGAEWYDEVLAESSEVLDEQLIESWSPDDLYMLYTGGTTGMPKGVLWRQADIFVASLGGRKLENREEWASLDEVAAYAIHGGAKVAPIPPFMHGAAHWLAFSAFTNANTLVVADITDHFDSAEVIDLIDREAVEVLLIVGDAFGRPMVEELERNPRHLDSLLIVVSGGAILSPGVKQRLVEAVPTMMILDGLGASETGTQASQLTSMGQTASSGVFVPTAGAAVLSDDLTTVLEPGHEEIGWVGQFGRIPLGYLNDPAKTAATFPNIDSERYAVPGDRGRLLDDGRLEVYGRESATINTGGEKVFAEEVEQAIIAHPEVLDCVVTGRKSDRWGEEVVAIAEVLAGSAVTNEEILELASQHIARFKLPKEVVRVDKVHRSPSGKADYRWAKSIASSDRVDGS